MAECFKFDRCKGKGKCKLSGSSKNIPPQGCSSHFCDTRESPPCIWEAGDSSLGIPLGCITQVVVFDSPVPPSLHQVAESVLPNRSSSTFY